MIDRLKLGRGARRAPISAVDGRRDQLASASSPAAPDVLTSLPHRSWRPYRAAIALPLGSEPSGARVSQLERGELATIDAVARYVEALGGRLDLIASFGDHTLTVTTTEAA